MKKRKRTMFRQRERKGGVGEKGRKVSSTLSPNPPTPPCAAGYYVGEWKTTKNEEEEQKTRK